MTYREAAADFADNIIADIQKRIRGRICHEHHNCNYVAWEIAQAGHGDHLEIGTLHGGTAILAVLVKMKNHLKGDVYCIDPLDGYYIGTRFAHPIDRISGVPVTPEVLLGNLETFGVADRVHIIRARSHPFPEQLNGRGFITAYIDGDHYGNVPRLDWEACKSITMRTVIFDNADAGHPDVMNTVMLASRDPEWRFAEHEGITAVLRRKESYV